MASMRYNRARGTTLIEILVVIVIFLVGILAVLQIFPKGFQILVQGRNQTVATALSRDEVERLEARSAELPAMIVSASYDSNGNVLINPGVNPNSLGPQGDAIDQFGILSAAGNTLGDWTRFSGANTVRHIVGEGRIVPAPRMVGQSTTMYGGLLVLNFGPVDFFTNANTGTNSINVYGNDLNEQFIPANYPGLPTANLTGTLIASYPHSDDEYFVLNPQTSSVTLCLPTGAVTLANGSASAAVNRQYTLSFSAYIQANGAYVRRDYTGVTVTVPNATPDANGVFPLYEAPLASAIANLGSIDLSSLRVRRSFLQIASTANFANYDQYACKLLNPNLGVILFSPFAFGATVNGPSGPQPLQARVDYDVYDWRILREDFRFPSNQMAQHVLPIGALKIAGQVDFDGRTTTVMGPVEGTSSPTASADNPGESDNFALVDLDTGGIYMERNTLQPAPATGADAYITVNKSSGLITVKDLDGSTPGTQANLLLPDGTILPNVTIDNRAVRALYVAKNQYSVQVLKSAASYTQTTNRPGAGQFALGSDIGGAATRIYFPVSDLGRKVSVGVINYRHTSDSSPRQMHDQDFVIAYPSVSDAVGLPCIDVANVDYSASTLDVNIDSRSFGYAVDGVKGASVAVRTLWNPNMFQLGTDPSDTAPSNGVLGGNITRVDQWGRAWRQATNDTYLEQGDLIP